MTSVATTPTVATDAATRVTFESQDGIAHLTLNSPPLNILSVAMMCQLTDRLTQAAADPTIKGVALTATGKAFSAGADVGEHKPEHAAAMIDAFSRLFDAFDRLTVPVAMLVEGAALGGGFELALMADVLLATETATFGQPEIRLGFIAPVGLTALPTLVGRAKAIEIVTTGRVYSAAEMKALGVVSRVVPVNEGAAALQAVLSEWRKASPLIMRMNVMTLKRLLGQPFSEARRAAEGVFLRELMQTQDVLEGIAAFYEKRSPVWRNR